MYLSIFLTILSIFINGFLIGKIFKRFRPTLNAFQFLLFGSITYIGFLIALLIPLFLFTINLKFIFIYYLAFQCILVLVYAFNWRWIFITYVLDYKKILFFLFLVTILIIGWVLTRSLSTNSGWIINLSEKTIANLTVTENHDISTIIAFDYTYDFSNNLIVNYIRGFIYISKLYNPTELLVYITTIFLFIIIYLSALGFASFYYKENIYWFNYICFSFLVLLFSVVVFSFQTYAFIIVFTFLLVGSHFYNHKIAGNNMTIIVVNFLVFAGFGIDVNFVLVAFIINLIISVISYQKKIEMATDYNVLSILSTLLSLPLLFNNTFYIGLILLVLFLLFYLFYFLFKTSSIYKSTLTRIDNFLYTNINFITILISLIVLVLSIILFIISRNVSYDPWIIDTKTFINQALISSVGTKKFNICYWIINVIFWITNVLIFAYSLIMNSLLNKAFKFREESAFNYYANFSLLIITMFWNPFFVNVLVKMINLSVLNFSFDIRTFFWAASIPILLQSNSYVFSSNKITINKSISIGIIISVLSIIISLKNFV